MTDSTLLIQGLPASPYTRKMLALLRYRRIPYRFIQSAEAELPAPKIRLMPVLYFADDGGELAAFVDSTPLIRRLEEDYSGRSVIPKDPVVAFINYLLEDYGDEWLTKAMFHYRWTYQDDIEMAGSILPHYNDITRPDEVVAEQSQLFSKRQIDRLYVVGSNETTAPVIERSYQRFIACLNDHLKAYPFIMGNRPGSADFACFGQLTQLAHFDPTPSNFAARNFPRVHAWVSVMEDQSGLEPSDDAFVSVEKFPSTLRAILSELGRTYVPVMLANAKATASGLEQVDAEVDGRRWVQQPFPYQAKCVHWIRGEYAQLDDAGRNRVDDILAGTGCEELLRPI